MTKSLVLLSILFRGTNDTFSCQARPSSFRGTTELQHSIRVIALAYPFTAFPLQTFLYPLSLLSLSYSSDTCIFFFSCLIISLSSILVFVTQITNNHALINGLLFPAQEQIMWSGNVMLMASVNMLVHSWTPGSICVCVARGCYKRMGQGGVGASEEAVSNEAAEPK